MRKSKKVDSKNLALEIGHILSKYFLQTEDLHFGYWTDDLEVNVSNLWKAQENHSEFILDHFPESGGFILDVGGGAGRFARKLVDRGFRVDVVIPSSYLAQRIREVLENGTEVHVCKYEDLVIDKQYDLILFSESFQYVHMETALSNSMKLLKDGGYLLICDFFQKDVTGKKPIKGGHRLSEFHEAISKTPFKEIENIDITRETAPTLDIVDSALKEVAIPVIDLVRESFQYKHPLLTRIVRWKFRKKIDKVERRYLSGLINSQTFTHHKSYRLLLYQKG